MYEIEKDIPAPDKLEPRAKSVNLKGMKFGRLTVLKVGYRKKSRIFWLCVCECGNESFVMTRNLTEGDTKSCGCFRDEKRIETGKTSNLKHGHNRNRNRSGTYSSYHNMLTRCYNPNALNYKWYGEKGIKVCERWLESFENFLEDMGERPDDFTIERINGFDDYKPENCKWIPQQEQPLNTSRTPTSEEIEFIRNSDLSSRRLGEILRPHSTTIGRIRKRIAVGEL